VRGVLAVVGCGVVLGLSAPVSAETPSPPPEAVRQFQQRQAALPPGGVALQLDLADWALDNGLLFQAEQLYRLVLARDPLNPRAYEALLRAADERPLPRRSKAYDDARSHLPPRFTEYQTKRFIVLSDAESTWTRRQAQRLERTYHQFHRFTRRLDLRPLPLKHKLVCILFKDRDAYRGFARTHDDVTDFWIAGYYAPMHDRVVFYRGDANPSVVKARGQLDEMRADIASLDREAHQAEREGRHDWADVLRQHGQRYRRHVKQETRRVDQFAEQVSTATTVHETVHQLSFHTGIQSPRCQYPLWLSEGLATAFETDSTGHAFGPDHEYAPRREMFEQLLREDGLIDLAELVTWASIPDGGDELVHGAYQQFYALMTWMSRFRTQELRCFLESMLIHPVRSPDSTRYRQLFEQAFGDIDRLEAAWLRYERSRLADSLP